MNQAAALAALAAGRPCLLTNASDTDWIDCKQALNAVVLEEKLDGANLGFSVSLDGVVRAQNRGQYLPQPFHGQFARLAPWLDAHWRSRALEWNRVV